jgi:hypothetical protein
MNSSSIYLFDIHLVVDLIQTIASIAIIIDAIEIIIERNQYSSDGIFNFEVLGSYKRWMTNGKVAPIYNIILNYPNYIFLVFIQLIVAILVISHLFTNLSLFFIMIILLIHLLSHLRNQYGVDGSDQMQVIIFASLLAFYATSDPIVQKFSIFFLCFQSLLSYFMSGLAKLSSPTWRGGMAITGITNTESFGNKVLSQILFKKPQLSKLVCWCIIIFECVFPILIFTGIQSTVFFILVGMIFHFSISIFMRLNSFFWSFIATYPALLFFAAEFQNFVGSIHFLH